MARILVVEDEALVAMVVEDHLREAGHEVIGSAVEQQQAVEMAVAQQPDLVLMDVHLYKGSDGVAAAIEILDRIGIRTVFTSAQTDADIVERAQLARPLGWLVKPHSGVDLVVADALRQSAD